jgi:hypothetical protein
VKAELLQKGRGTREQRNRGGGVPNVDEAAVKGGRSVGKEPPEAVDVRCVEACF